MNRQRWSAWILVAATACLAFLVSDLARADGASNEKLPEMKSTKTSSTRPRESSRATSLPAPSKKVLGAMLKLHNDVRAQHGLAPLQLDGRLTAAAQRYADYVQRSNQFGHYADGRSPGDRISAEGVVHGSWAENMAWGQSTPEESMNTWLGSGGHYGNILSGHSHVGFGQVGGVWVTVFANIIEQEDSRPSRTALASEASP